jgi:hypothetical protein
MEKEINAREKQAELRQRAEKLLKEKNGKQVMSTDDIIRFSCVRVSPVFFMI